MSRNLFDLSFSESFLKIELFPVFRKFLCYLNVLVWHSVLEFTLFSNNHHSNSLIFQTVKFCSSEKIFDSPFRKQILKTDIFPKTEANISPLHSNHVQQPHFFVMAMGTASKLSFLFKLMSEKKDFGLLQELVFEIKVVWSAETVCITKENCFATSSKWASHLLT